ncbi:hypothetical protein QYE76_002417 [Lolium multiflorum]|uniref:Transposase (putative) gypsy type domain-containing protein n=1 Tax=Lolium multiflorum TaxID=4521 RepID=A0AAD8RNW8_LOLMU|nr:hypothetical protein QYE76_002417 [Lolium multiflorum]
MAAGDLDWERSKISNQDLNLMKKLGLMKKDDAIRFPSEESYPNPPMEYRVSFVDHLIRGLSAPIHDFLRGLLFVYGIQLHQLTPNSILHISIFITLCECFLGIPPNWALWKRIFLLRRNASRNATYNIGGVVICVRTDVEYFDVKFPDSVQGWRKKWLYIHEESANSVEHNIVPFDGNAKIQRRRSWDAEASEEEKKATEALMSRIRQLQNTRGEELSGVQITAYFLRIRVQPLQARKNPLWTYTGVNDANRLSSDLSAKDLEKLIRRISRLNKKDPVPSSCRVVPYSSTNPLPEVFLTILLCLLFLPFLRMEKSKNKLSLPKTIKVPLFMKPMIKDLLRIGAQFVGYREYANKTEEKLAEANERANTLAQQLEQSEQARIKAESMSLVLWKVIRPTRTAQEFQLEEPVNDPLLDALSFLEVHGSEAREGIDQAKAGLSRLFPYFFPKKEEPATFVDLAKSFNSAEDLGLKMRQENMKVAVESTVALVANSQQTIDWMKSRESSEKEKIALQRAQDAISERDTAVAEADAAASRENSMLQLLTDASLDMAVLLFIPFASALQKPSSATMSSSSSSSSGLSAQSSPFREPTPEWDPQGAHAANIRRAIEDGDESSHDFSVWSEDDKSLTDGESDLRFLAGESEEESEDDRLSWGDFTSSEEVKDEEEEEDDTSSDEPPAKRFCPWPGNLSDFDNDDDADEEDEDNEGRRRRYKGDDEPAGSSADNGDDDDEGSNGP